MNAKRNRRLGILGIPVDLGGQRRGTDMGPSAIRYAQLQKTLTNIGFEVKDYGNIDILVPESKNEGNPNLKYLEELIEIWARAREAVEKIMEEGRFPVILGGDHSMSVGTVAGVLSAEPDLGLIWFDAHGDFNDEVTTTSGNIHGMSLGALVGHGPEEILATLPKRPMIDESRTVLIGARSIDPGERRKLQASDVTIFSMRDIDELGIAEVIRRAIHISTAGGNSPNVHISFDLDIVDPGVAKGVGTPVPGGLSYREAHLALEMLSEAQIITSMEVTEVNPILDNANSTATLTVGLIASALGKTII